MRGDPAVSLMQGDSSRRDRLLMLKSVDMSALPAKSISHFPQPMLYTGCWVSMCLALAQVVLQGSHGSSGDGACCATAAYGHLLFFQPCTATNHVNSGSENMSGFGTINCSSTYKSLYCCAWHIKVILRYDQRER